MQLVTKAKIISASASILLARIVGADGIPYIQSDLTSIVMKVFDVSVKPPVIVGSAVTLGVSDVVSNTLQTDPTGLLWSDDDGFNFSFELDGETYTPGNEKTYQIQFRLVPTTGDSIELLFQLGPTVPVYV
jgi:hypothetical protein